VRFLGRDYAPVRGKIDEELSMQGTHAAGRPGRSLICRRADEGSRRGSLGARRSAGEERLSDADRRVSTVEQ
jgi:hypothetical protein